MTENDVKDALVKNGIWEIRCRTCRRWVGSIMTDGQPKPSWDSRCECGSSDVDVELVRFQVVDGELHRVRDRQPQLDVSAMTNRRINS